jgi:hypothetical protein
MGPSQRLRCNNLRIGTFPRAPTPQHPYENRTISQSPGVVDGNVIRVLSRLRVIGADVTAKHTTAALWALANQMVDPTRSVTHRTTCVGCGSCVLGADYIADVCLPFAQCTFDPWLFGSPTVSVEVVH